MASVASTEICPVGTPYSSAIDLNRARVRDTWVITSGGNTKGPLEDDVLRASNREMAARSRYRHLRRRVFGGDRSEIENRMPLLYRVIRKHTRETQLWDVKENEGFRLVFNCVYQLEERRSDETNLPMSTRA